VVWPYTRHKQNGKPRKKIKKRSKEQTNNNTMTQSPWFPSLQVKDQPEPSS